MVEQTNEPFELGALDSYRRLIMSDGLVFADRHSDTALRVEDARVFLSESLSDSVESQTARALSEREYRIVNASFLLGRTLVMQAVGLAAVAFYIIFQSHLLAIYWLLILLAWGGVLAILGAWLALFALRKDLAKRENVKGTWVLRIGDGINDGWTFEVSPERIEEVLKALRGAGASVSRKLDEALRSPTE